MMKFLIPEARSAWRMASVQIATLAIVFGALPADQQAAILALLGIDAARIPGVLGLAVILARVIDQPKVGATPATPAAPADDGKW